MNSFPGVVPAAPEHRPLHRGEDVALERAGDREALGFGEGVVGELRGPAHALELGGALDEAKLRDEPGGVLEAAEAVERRLHPPPICGGEAVGVELHPDPFAGRAVTGRHLPQLARRVAPRLVHPDPDILDHRRVLRLAEVRGAGEEGHAPVPPEPQALEEAEPEGVVAGEVEHALGLEHEEAGETAGVHRPAGGGAAGRELFGGKVNGHGRALPSCVSGAGAVSRSGARTAAGTRPPRRRPSRRRLPPPTGRPPRVRSGRAPPLR